MTRRSTDNNNQENNSNKTTNYHKNIDYYFKRALYYGVLGGIIFVGTLAFFIEQLDEFNLLRDYKKIQCDITEVEYPTSLRSPLNMKLWYNCNCGKYCESYYPCLNLYTNYSSNNMINNFEETDSLCTYFSKECHDFENPFNVWSTLNYTIKRGQYMLNTSIECYVHKHHPEENTIYLSLNEDQSKLITCIVFVCIGLVLLLVCLVYFTIGIYPQKSVVCYYYLENGCCACCRRCSKKNTTIEESSKSNNQAYVKHIVFNENVKYSS